MENVVEKIIDALIEFSGKLFFSQNADLFTQRGKMYF